MSCQIFCGLLYWIVGVMRFPFSIGHNKTFHKNDDFNIKGILL